MKSNISKITLSLLFISILSFTTGVVFAANNNESWYLGGNKLVAGKSIIVGEINLDLDETLDKLTVEIITEEGVLLVETHIHVATSLDGIPQKNGNPIPGQFDDNMEHDPLVDTYSQVFDVPETGFAFIAIHAVVQIDTNCETDEETAWGGWCEPWTDYFPGKNWAIYIKYPLAS